MIMKRLRIFSFFLVGLLFWSCDSENGLNCFQAAGTIVQQEFEVKAFEKILVRPRVQLIVSQGPEQRVVVETGENLMSDIVVASLNNTLSIKNNNGCNLVREYGITKVFVTAPNIKEIRNSSGLEIQSDGVLAFPELLLLSEDEENQDQFHIDGDFRLDLNVGTLSLVGTGISNFFLSGTANEANFEIFNGDGRIESADLQVNNLNIFHRGTQKMIVHPLDSLRGEIRGLGDVISVNEPTFVDVEEFFTGRLIFEGQ